MSRLHPAALGRARSAIAARKPIAACIRAPLRTRPGRSHPDGDHPLHEGGLADVIREDRTLSTLIDGSFRRAEEADGRTNHGGGLDRPAWPGRGLQITGTPCREGGETKASGRGSAVPFQPREPLVPALLRLSTWTIPPKGRRIGAAPEPANRASSFHSTVSPTGTGSTVQKGLSAAQTPSLPLRQAREAVRALLQRPPDRARLVPGGNRLKRFGQIARRASCPSAAATR